MYSHLDLGLDVLNRVAGFNLQGDGLPSEGLHEDLHSATEPEHQVESALLLDVVVGESPPILQLFASEDEPLLVWWDSLLVLRTERLFQTKCERNNKPGFWPSRSQ